ncbi:MAG: ABC transporter permease [Lachnospiraceae bacterium]|nr:ABC transporter permease [Lachnospiraceae bacterium]
MNKYVFLKVFHKIKCSKLVYTTLVVQFAIGFFIINLTANVESTVNEQYKKIVDEGRDKQYDIACNLVNEDLFDNEKFDLLSWGKKKTSPGENQNLPYSQEDIDYVVKQIGEEGVVAENCEIMLIALSETEAKEYQIHYQSDCNLVKMSTEFQDIEEKITEGSLLNPRDFPYTYDNKKQKIVCNDTDKEYNVEICKEETADLWLPFELYQPYYHYKDVANITLSIKFLGGKPDNISVINEKLLNIRNYLNKSHKDYKYTISNEFFEYMGKISTAKDENYIFTLIAGVFFLIIVIGLVGLFLLFMERRKRELAIAISLGAQRRYLVMELFLEVLCISLIGYVMGAVIAAKALIAGWEFATVIIYFNWKISVLLISVPILISVVSIIPSVYMILNLKPMEILRDL